MDLVIISAVLFCVGVPLLLVGLLLGGNKLADRTIGATHHDLEAILQDGTVPAHWSKAVAQKIERLTRSGDMAGAARARQEAQARYLQRLDQLIEYIAVTRLVDSEETRQLVRGKLEEIKLLWEHEGETT